MKLEPIRRYPQPKLPTRDVANENPELLRLLPKRWQANSAVAAALTACLVMTTCRSDAAKTASKVAPIFEHGKGSGSFGCVAVNPPIFLSEAEARQVVIEEGKRSGIVFVPEGKTLNNIEIPTNGTYARVDKPDGTAGWEKQFGKQTKPITLDALDKKRGISFEFVSEQDLKDWKSGVMEFGTAGSTDLIGTAKALRDSIAKTKPAGTYGVFYDPAVGWDDAREKAGKLDYSDPNAWEARNAKIKAAAGELAKEELRKQVQDFIKWLKAQGVV